MIHRKIIISPVLFLVLFVNACTDIIEKNITNKELVIIAPGNNIHTSIATQTFWWEYLDGATSYTLQVVSPSFASVEKVIIDTTITLNKFMVNLFPGKFEWRVGAQNGSYATPYIVSTLQIDSTTDLKTQNVTLIAPLENDFTNAPNIIFHWQKLYNADNYSFEIHKTDWNGSLMYSAASIIYDTLSLKSLADGTYTWGIKAWNANSATGFTTRSFTIDRIAPGIPNLLTPADKAKLTQLQVNFSWNRPSDTGSPLSDSLIVASDSLFSVTKIVVAEFISEMQMNYALPDTGTYYWKVKSIDAAGNHGQFSAIRRFTVKNQ